MPVALGSLLLSVPAGAARLDGSGDARQQATQLTAAANAVASTGVALDRLRSRPATTVAIDQVRADLQVTQAAFDFRNAIRQEQELVYSVAGRTDVEAGTLALLPAARAGEVSSVDHALRALWAMSGYDPGLPVHPRHNRPFDAPDPVEMLLAYYRAAGARAGIDWTYLAAINYIESDFGRNLGPSSAGALGPMQFLPATFDEYGAGGDIMSAHDSIQAAAALLARNGAPADYGRAILRYNHSQGYMTAVEAFAAAIRSDPVWVTRLYYWSTFG